MDEEALKKLFNTYSELEMKLLNEIVQHFKINEEFINSDYWKVKKLEELGILNENIVKYISQTTNQTPNQVAEALEKVGFDTLNIQNLNNAYNQGLLNINPSVILEKQIVNNLINYSYDKITSRLMDISNKIEIATRNTYLDIVENAYLQTNEGIPYQEAIRNCLLKLGENGITTLSYKTVDENGNIVGIRNYDIEGAVRRELITATHNLTNEINKSVAEELDVEYLFLSEHIKCRPQHFDWQGTIIKRVDMVAITKYGEVDGMGGPNCKHYPTPYFGDARGSELKTISLEEATEQYNLSQKQRYLERGIRKWKRRERIFKTAEDEEYHKKCKNKVKEWQLRNKEFTESHNLKRDFSRENVEKVTRVEKYDIITANNLPDKLGMHSEDYKPFGKIDPFENKIQEKVSELLGYNNLPQLLNSEQYERYNGEEIVRVVHSYHGKTAQEAYENTIKGSIQYSENTNSSYGRGIYFGKKVNENELLSVYGREDSKIIKAKLSRRAKILEFEKQFDYLVDVEERLDKLNDKHLKDFYKHEKSLLYMLDGYDGIKINSKGYYCIYNRGVLRINV